MKTLLSIVFILGFAIAHLQAEAILEKVKGDVRVQFTKGSKKFKTLRVRTGYVVEEGDVIRTRKGAMIHLKFGDGKIVLIKENSIFKVGVQKKNIRLDFKQGEFLIGIKKKLGEKERFTVKTPSAVAAVRGTLFWGLSDAHKNTTYACFENKIDISAQGVTKTLEPGLKVVIPFGKAPGKIENAGVPIEYLDTFAIDGTIHGMKEMIKKE